MKHAQIGTPMSEAGSFPGDDNSSTTSDDSFEQIDKAELVDEVQTEAPSAEVQLEDTSEPEKSEHENMPDSQDPLFEKQD